MGTTQPTQTGEKHAVRECVEAVLFEYLADRHGTAAVPYARESGLADKVLDALGLEQVGWWEPRERELHHVEERNSDCDLLGCQPVYSLTKEAARA